MLWNLSRCGIGDAVADLLIAGPENLPLQIQLHTAQRRQIPKLQASGMVKSALQSCQPTGVQISAKQQTSQLADLQTGKAAQIEPCTEGGKAFVSKSHTCSGHVLTCQAEPAENC